MRLSFPSLRPAARTEQLNLSASACPHSRVSPRPALSARTHRSAHLFLSSICAILIVCALTAPPALAERTFENQISGLAEPTGLTVDPADNVWISGRGHAGQISEFTPSGEPLSHLTDNEVLREACAQSLAVTYTENLYASIGCGAGSSNVTEFEASGVHADFKLRGKGSFPTFGSFALADAAGQRREMIYATRLNNNPGPEEEAPAGIESYERYGNPASFTGSAPYIVDGIITGTPAGPFGSLGSLATDSAGDIYMIDNANRRIDEFHPDGTFVRAIVDTGVPEGFSQELTGVSIDPTTGNLLAVDSGHSAVDEFTDLGTFVTQIRGTSPTTPFAHLSGGIGLSSTGALYVVDNGAGVVVIFSSSSTRSTRGQVSTGSARTSEPDAATLEGEENSEGNALEACQFEYGTETPYGMSTPCEPAAPSIPVDGMAHTVRADLTNLSANTTYLYRLTMTNSTGTITGPVRAFTTPPPALPIVSSTSASNITSTSATFTAEVNPQYGTTLVQFEYGPNGVEYESTSPFMTLPETDAIDQSVTATTSTLSPGSTYHYRAHALNFAGPAYGPDRTFTTINAPTVEDGNATVITSTSADLHASIDPNLSPTTFHFDYGSTERYGSLTASDMIGGTALAQQETVHLSGLTPGSSYHFQAVAENAAGLTHGLDETFATSPSVQMSQLPQKCKRGQVKRHGSCLKRRKRHRHVGRHTRG